LNKIKPEAAILLVILALIWGSSFILMKKGLLVYPPEQVASLRILMAGIVFVPYIIKAWRRIPLDKFGYIMLFGLLELGIPPYLYTFAQTHVDSSTAGILNSMVPIFTLSTGFLFFRLKYHFLTTLGVLTGLSGALLITYFRSGSGGATMDLTNSWGLLIVLATLFYGLGSNILKEKLDNVPGALITGTAFVSLAIPAGIHLLFTNFTSIPLSETQNLHSFLGIVLLSVFGSALAIVIFSKLIKISNALFASFVTWLIPFVSLLWGWLDGEAISYLHFSSMAIIFAGIYLSGLREKTVIKDT
jgi:drug/metabolite transporter (DMT)-like permease